MPVAEIAEELRQSLLEELEQRLEDVARAVEDAVFSEAPEGDTQELRRSILVEPWRFDGQMFSTFVRATAEHALYTDEGTGVYGPTGDRIYPKTASVLVFYWKKAGGVVAFPSVAGQPAQHWFQEPMPYYYDVALERA